MKTEYSRHIRKKGAAEHNPQFANSIAESNQKQIIDAARRQNAFQKFIYKGQEYCIESILNDCFILGNNLAQGGFGTVFEGIDARNMKNVVVKIVSGVTG